MFKHLLSISLMITAGSAMAAQGIDAVNCTGDQIEIFMGDNTTVSSVTSVSYGGNALSLDNATNNGAEVIIVPVASCATKSVGQFGACLNNIIIIMRHLSVCNPSC